MVADDLTLPDIVNFHFKPFKDGTPGSSYDQVWLALPRNMASAEAPLSGASDICLAPLSSTSGFLLVKSTVSPPPPQALKTTRIVIVITTSLMLRWFRTHPNLMKLVGLFNVMILRILSTVWMLILTVFVSYKKRGVPLPLHSRDSRLLLRLDQTCGPRIAREPHVTFPLLV